MTFDGDGKYDVNKGRKTGMWENKGNKGWKTKNEREQDAVGAGNSIMRYTKL